MLWVARAQNGAYHKDVPCGEVASLNILEHGLNTVFRVLARELGSLCIGESLEAAPNPEMDLDVIELALSINEFESVTGVSVHVVVAVGGAAVREQDHDLVNGFRVLRQIVLETNVSIQTYVEDIATLTQNISASFKWVCGSRFWV